MRNKKQYVYFWSLFTAIFFLSSCTNTPNSNTTPNPIEYIVVTATASASTNTPDPCAPGNLETEVLKIHSHMREFDDSASLAGSIMQGIAKNQMQMSDLSNAIPNMQRIKREAEDQPTPACLVNLKTYQINHMYTVLNSLNAFLSGDQQGFDQSVAVARQYHDQYAVELARLLGQTVLPIAPAQPNVVETPSQ